MENVVVHIISHSHWDREWYLPFESHRMQLVELFDNLFDLFENDPEFKSFHLDGQTIVLDDYLEIRPEDVYKRQSLHRCNIHKTMTAFSVHRGNAASPRNEMFLSMEYEAVSYTHLNDFHLIVFRICINLFKTLF